MKSSDISPGFFNAGMKIVSFDLQVKVSRPAMDCKAAQETETAHRRIHATEMSIAAWDQEGTFLIEKIKETLSDLSHSSLLEWHCVDEYLSGLTRRD